MSRDGRRYCFIDTDTGAAQLYRCLRPALRDSSTCPLELRLAGWETATQSRNTNQRVISRRPSVRKKLLKTHPCSWGRISIVKGHWHHWYSNSTSLHSYTFTSVSCTVTFLANTGRFSLSFYTLKGPGNIFSQSASYSDWCGPTRTQYVDYFTWDISVCAVCLCAFSRWFEADVA